MMNKGLEQFKLWALLKVITGLKIPNKSNGTNERIIDINTEVIEHQNKRLSRMQDHIL